MSNFRIGFFGGSFNPPHITHVLATTYLLSTNIVDQVMVVPVFSHAFNKDLVPFRDRIKMCQLAFGWIPGIFVNDIESELSTPNRTYNTLNYLISTRPGCSFRLIIGDDILEESEKWYKFDEIKKLAPPFVFGRNKDNNRFLPIISSTEIREALNRGTEEDIELLKNFVPANVLKYINEKKLFSRKLKSI